MLESPRPRPRPSLGRLTRAIGPAVGAATVCLTLGTNNVSLTPVLLEHSRPELQAGTADGVRHDLECLLRLLMGLECDPEPTEEPPTPIEPIQPSGLI